MIATSGQEQQKKRAWLSYSQKLLLEMEMTRVMGEKLLSPFKFSVFDWLKSPSFKVFRYSFSEAILIIFIYPCLIVIKF